MLSGYQEQFPAEGGHRIHGIFQIETLCLFVCLPVGLLCLTSISLSLWCSLLCHLFVCELCSVLCVCVCLSLSLSLSLVPPSLLISLIYLVCNFLFSPSYYCSLYLFLSLPRPDLENSRENIRKSCRVGKMLGQQPKNCWKTTRSMQNSCLLVVQLVVRLLFCLPVAHSTPSSAIFPAAFKVRHSGPL